MNDAAIENLKAANAKMTAELNQLRAIIQEQTAFITNLALGGSENFHRFGDETGFYYADLDVCGKKIRERIEKQPAKDTKIKKLAAELDQLRADYRAAVTEVRVLRDAVRLSSAALFPEPTKRHDGMSTSSDALFNLEGALIDLRRMNADKVCINTIQRVCNQLASARAALNGVTE